MNILLTGASGFVGKHLGRQVDLQGAFTLTSVVRRPGSAEFGHEVLVNSLDAGTEWFRALRDQQVVIHAAARAHIVKDETPDPLAEYRRVNVDGTVNLARQAAAAGVKRFIYISSIKVNGDEAPLDKPFTAHDIPAPEDPYGISKLEAELGLGDVSRDTGMEVVIIRPPLVYGRGVKGNFASMTKLVEKGLPLPLGAVHNKRSLVSLDNLVDLIITCIDHPAAANQVFLAGDGEDLSTSELLRRVGTAMGKPARLLPVPAALLQFGATVLGKNAMAQRLLGSLQVDISKTRDVLGWEPPVSVDEGLRRCFRNNQDG